MQGSQIQNNIPLIEHLFGATEAEQRAGSPTTYAENASVPATLLVSADPSAVPGSKGYIAAQASQNYAQLLTGWGHEATWTHFDNETHASLMSNFGTPGDGPTGVVATFLDELRLP